MNRIEEKFRYLAQIKKKAFIAYIMAGDPEIESTKEMIFELAKSGVDIIELGIPFSDPIADGPVIQRASQRAINSGTNIIKVLKMVSAVRKIVDIPLIGMTYYNLIFNYGLKRFIADAKISGLDGLIIPDLPPEEARELIALCRKRDFCLVFLLAPTSTEKRIKIISKLSSGFIYYVSVTGVTGIRKKLPAGTISSINTIRKYTTKPICIGFGLSNPQQLHFVKKIADGAIVGSAIVDIIARFKGQNERRRQLRAFVANMVKELKR
ncbi:MAG: tryptophan synthase subunit alpha [Candidatus Omnitrophota bacterium]